MVEQVVGAEMHLASSRAVQEQVVEAPQSVGTAPVFEAWADSDRRAVVASAPGEPAAGTAARTESPLPRLQPPAADARSSSTNVRPHDSRYRTMDIALAGSRRTFGRLFRRDYPREWTLSEHSRPNTHLSTTGFHHSPALGTPVTPSTRTPF